MLLKYFMNDFGMVPVARIIIGITFVCAFHMRCISVARSLYFRIFSVFWSFIIIIIIVVVVVIVIIEFGSYYTARGTANLISGSPLHIILTYYNFLFHAVNLHITLTKYL
jgi:hypothetical protein